MLALSLDMYTGWPTSLQLDDGSILTAYAITAYHEHGRGSTDDAAAETVRCEIPDGGGGYV